MTPAATPQPISAPFAQLGVALVPTPREWWRGGLIDSLSRRPRRSTAQPASI